MKVQLIITFLILTCSIILFMSNGARADLVAVLALLALVLTGGICRILELGCHYD